jgi:hypothetical protein
MLRRMKRLAALMLVLIGCDGSLMPPAPPLGAPSRQKLASGRVELIGDVNTACAEAASGQPIWCAFTRRGAGVDAELWAVDLARRTPCDGPGPGCLRLSTKLWTRRPRFSASYPEIDEFSGQTLFIYNDGDRPTTLPDDPYAGPISAWRPGWPEARLVAAGGYTCRGVPGAAVAYCLESVTPVRRNVEFDLLAGTLSASAPGPLPRAAHLAARGSNGQVMWGAAFTPGGERLAFSGPSADGTGEVLRAIETAAVGRDQPKDLIAGAARWQLSSDGKKIYFLDGFNYLDRNDKPAGALTMVDFPAGTNRQTLQAGVGDFVALPGPGLGFLQDMSGGSGTLRMIRDRARPTDVATVDTAVEEFAFSARLDYSYVFKAEGDAGPQTFVARSDGNGHCVLNSRPGSLLYLVTFLPSSRLVAYVEDDANDDAQAFYTDPEGCQDKRRFASQLAFLAPVGSGLAFGEVDQTQRRTTLRHAVPSGGALAEDGGTLLEPAVDFRVAIAGGRYIVYTITEAEEEAQGLYVYGPLP